MKYWLKLAFVIISFFLIKSNEARSESLLTGKVTDAYTGHPLRGVKISVINTVMTTFTDTLGKYSITIPSSAKKLVFSFVGFLSLEVEVGERSVVDVKLETEHEDLSKVIVISCGCRSYVEPASRLVPGFVRDNNSNIAKFQSVSNRPFSTFPVTVNRGAYGRVRDLLNAGKLPPAGFERTEELINYFDYEYPDLSEGRPLKVNVEVAESPWNRGLQLVQIGIQAKKYPPDSFPPSNLVFLIDMSESMSRENKLSAIKAALKKWIFSLRAVDKVSIVTYWGGPGLVLSPTKGHKKARISKAIDRMESGARVTANGSLHTAYALANAGFVSNGNNRIVIVSDGDWSLGTGTEEEVRHLIQQRKRNGVKIDIIGASRAANYSRTAETLAFLGGGRYTFSDNDSDIILSLRKAQEGDMHQMAEDIRIKVAFNPASVEAYRLLGYESGIVQSYDFEDTLTRGGTLESGQTVTAIYEIRPSTLASAKRDQSGTLFQLSVQYKDNRSGAIVNQSVLATHGGKPLEVCSENMRFASAVAEFALLLRYDDYMGSASYDAVLKRARGAIGQDKNGSRADFLKLVEMAKFLDQ